MRSKAEFLVGCVAGCLLSSMFYLWWSGLFVSTHYTHHAHLAALHSVRVTQGSNEFSRQSNGPVALSSELRSKKTLLIAVLASRARFNRTVAMVNETWAAWMEPEVDYAIFAAGTGAPVPNVYWLRGMQDLAEGEGNLNQMFYVLKYLRSSFVRQYQWFLLVSENTYIVVQDLVRMLSGLDASKPVYMGHFASEDRKTMARLHLLPNEYYCVWGPGIVLSNAALVAIAIHLDSCRHLADTFGSQSSNSHLELGRGDVELGRCFSRQVGVQCTSFEEAHAYFVHDPDNYSLTPEHLWYSAQFENLLTLYPVRDVDHMQAVHHFALARDMQRLQQKLVVIEDRTNKICKQVSPDFAAPLSEPSARSCNLPAQNSTFSTVGSNSISEEFPKMIRVRNRYEVTPWMYVTPTGLYRSTTTEPYSKVMGEIKEEINFIIHKAISITNLREASEWVLWKFLGCHVRYLPLQGRQYLLDMVLTGKKGELRRKRLKILRPHSPDIVMQDDTGDEEFMTRINVLVPLNRVGDRFTEFLHTYEQQVLKKGENVTLILIVFGGEAQAVNHTMEQYRTRYPEADVRIVPSEEKFTRGIALNIGMSKLGDSELAFLCDVDMIFDSTFLSHCRLNTVQGERVYYPEFFKWYNMNYVYRFNRKPKNFAIRRAHGHWASYSYGMVCIYKSDYVHSGGFDLSITGWGGEDVDFFERVLATGIDILKSPEPSLSHRYHEKTCSLSLSPSQFAMCVSSRNEGLADRMQLAEYVYYLEDQYGIGNRSLWT